MASTKLILSSGTIKRLHVDRHVVARNRKKGQHKPPITVQTSRGPHKASMVDILGPSRFVYRPEKPLACGATLWVETTAEVLLY